MQKLHDEQNIKNVNKDMINKGHTEAWGKKTNQKYQYLSWSFLIHFYFLKLYIKILSQLLSFLAPLNLMPEASVPLASP